MADYIPLLSVITALAVFCVAIGWPWLRRRPNRDRTIMLCLVGLCLSAALYLWVGAPFTVGQIQAQQQQQTILLQRAQVLHDELTKLPDPDALAHANKWLELGSTYMQLEQPQAAVEPLRHAVLASGGEPEWIMLYGKAQMAAADGQVTEEAAEAFTMASRLMPDQPEPLFLLAVGRMQAGDRAGAHALYERLLPLLPEGAPLRQRLLQRLQESGKD